MIFTRSLAAGKHNLNKTIILEGKPRGTKCNGDLNVHEYYMISNQLKAMNTY